MKHLIYFILNESLTKGILLMVKDTNQNSRFIEVFLKDDI